MGRGLLSRTLNSQADAAMPWARVQITAIMMCTQIEFTGKKTKHVPNVSRDSSSLPRVAFDHLAVTTLQKTIPGKSTKKHRYFEFGVRAVGSWSFALRFSAQPRAAWLQAQRGSCAGGSW